MLLSTLALAGCQSPMYSGTPDDLMLTSPREDRSYVGRGIDADEAPAPASSTQAEPQYEYRGGRDPNTGRARTQM